MAAISGGTGASHVGSTLDQDLFGVDQRWSKECLYEESLRYKRDKKIRLNVGGAHFETRLSTLKRHPNTLLGSEEREYFYNDDTNEYFFDRDPDIFRLVLGYYQTGKLHYVNQECISMYDDELTFFRIPASEIGDCCYADYEENRELVKLRTMIDSFHRCHYSFDPMLMSIRERLWRKLSYDVTVTGFWMSPPTVIMTFVVLICTILAIIETVPCETFDGRPDSKRCGEEYKKLFLYMDTSCVTIFTLEYLLRLYAAPNRTEFAKSLRSLIDIVAVMPYYLGHIVGSKSVLGSFQTVRVVRFLRVFYYSKGLYILFRTLQSVAMEMGFFLISLSVTIILFSTIMFYMEKAFAFSTFVSIPATFWFAIETMTTTGYGDLVPQSYMGKFIGGVCCISGILLITLPVSITVSNFSRLYHQVMDRTDLRQHRLEDMQVPDNFQLQYDHMMACLGKVFVREKKRRRSSIWSLLSRKSSRDSMASRKWSTDEEGGSRRTSRADSVGTRSWLNCDDSPIRSRVMSFLTVFSMDGIMSRRSSTASRRSSNASRRSSIFSHRSSQSQRSSIHSSRKDSNEESNEVSKKGSREELKLRRLGSEGSGVRWGPYNDGTGVRRGRAESLLKKPSFDMGGGVKGSKVEFHTDLVHIELTDLTSSPLAGRRISRDQRQSSTDRDEGSLLRRESKGGLAPGLPQTARKGSYDLQTLGLTEHQGILKAARSDHRLSDAEEHRGLRDSSRDHLRQYGSELTVAKPNSEQGILRKYDHSTNNVPRLTCEGEELATSDLDIVGSSASIDSKGRRRRVGRDETMLSRQDETRTERQGKAEARVEEIEMSTLQSIEGKSVGSEDAAGSERGGLRGEGMLTVPDRSGSGRNSEGGLTPKSMKRRVSFQDDMSDDEA
ncbi:KCND3 [Branchiostoma lanceolatum]|uniref:KCND3 protein n=1 Tax=Branchiostoma lanceolatum TaxID=7740 RepID=A0A8K0A522_BRALA|nr:KCND3 [Branchiostoma lanceolatum]